MKEPAARELSLDILLSVTSGQTYSHIALRDVLDKYAYFEKAKRSMIKRLVEGVLENMLLLDEIIGQFSSVPVKKQKNVIRNILRMAVYEIFYMDAIPPHASVNEAVRLAERRGFRNLKGFVNGVLRTILREKEQIVLPDSLSIRYSMPAWIVDRWTKAFGKEKTESILKSFFGSAPLAVHLTKQPSQAKLQQALSSAVAAWQTEGNVLTRRETESDVLTRWETESDVLTRWEAEGIKASPVSGIPDAFFLSGVERLSAMQTFREGLFFVQDVSSMRALSEIPMQAGREELSGDPVQAGREELSGGPVHPGREELSGDPVHPGREELSGGPVQAGREELSGGPVHPGLEELSGHPARQDMEVLDLCGAPGGKSLYLASRIGDGGTITCRDLSENKVALIRDNIARCRFTNIHAEAADARLFDPAWESRADLVIADLPCSGLGVLGRKPEIRYRITPQEINDLAALQREILSTAQRYVKPGGLLFYSTCTITHEENEDNASWFCDTFPTFRKLKECQLFPEAGLQDGFYYMIAQRC